MYVFILLSGLLAASAMHLGDNPGNTEGYEPSYQNTIDLPDLQAEFRSALDELIDQVSDQARPVVNQIGEEIEQCKSLLQEEWSPCRQCVKSECGDEIEEMIESKMQMNDLIKPKSKRSYVAAASGAYRVADWITQASTGQSITGHVSGWFGRRNYAPVRADKSKTQMRHLTKPASKRIAFTAATGAYGAANLITQATTGKDIIGHVSGWWGRRSLTGEKNGMDARECMENCPICERFMGPVRKLLTSVCGPNIFLEFGTVAAPIKAIEQLREMNMDTPLLQRIEFTPTHANVYAVFPSGTMMYESRVPFSGPNPAARLAREYFMKYRKEREY